MDMVTRIQVLLDDRLAARFETYCRERGFKKSTLIARLVREHLDREAFHLERKLRARRAARNRSAQ